jgi:hypothetical protein
VAILGPLLSTGNRPLQPWSQCLGESYSASRTRIEFSEFHFRMSSNLRITPLYSIKGVPAHAEGCSLGIDKRPRTGRRSLRHSKRRKQSTSAHKSGCSCVVRAESRSLNEPESRIWVVVKSVSYLETSPFILLRLVSIIARLTLATSSNGCSEECAIPDSSSNSHACLEHRSYHSLGLLEHHASLPFGLFLGTRLAELAHMETLQ